jgi:hypothetical protein
VIRGPSVPAAPLTGDRVVIVCRNPDRRALLERLLGPTEVHASALDAVLSVTRRRARAVVLNLEDVAGAERDLVGALDRGRTGVQVFAVVSPEDEPLARGLTAAGLDDYFVMPGDVHRLPQTLFGRKAEPAAGAGSGAPPRASDAACRLAALALADPATILQDGGRLLLDALGAARGCVLTAQGPGGRFAMIASVGADGPGDVFGMERAVAERAAAAGEPLLVEMTGGAGPAAADALLCLPIRESGRTFGVVCLSRKAAGGLPGPADRAAAAPLAEALARLCQAAAQRDHFARLAQRDAETGLLRPEAFHTHLGRLLTRAGPESAEVGVVLLRSQADGPAAETESSGRIGRALAARLSDERLGGRLGPDHFAIAWPRRPETGATAADARRAFMAQAGSLADLGLFGLATPRLRISLAVFPYDGPDVQALLAAAEGGPSGA